MVSRVLPLLCSEHKQSVVGNNVVNIKLIVCRSRVLNIKMVYCNHFQRKHILLQILANSMSRYSVTKASRELVVITSLYFNIKYHQDYIITSLLTHTLYVLISTRYTTLQLNSLFYLIYLRMKGNG
jgi:hypothetical protein